MKHNLLSQCLFFFPHKSTAKYRRGWCLHRHQSMHMDVSQCKGYTVIYRALLDLLTILTLLTNTNGRSYALLPQIHTVVSALDKLSYSGPVKSTYPQTFIELGQVFLNTQDSMLLCFVVVFFSMWFSVCRRLVLCCTGHLYRSTAALRLHCHPPWTASTIEPTCLWTEWVRRQSIRQQGP